MLRSPTNRDSSKPAARGRRRAWSWLRATGRHAPTGRLPTTCWPRSPIWLAVLALGSVSISAVAADGPRETFSGATTTTLVEIPVEVTLEDAPVRGLEIGDFEVWDAGERVEILGLDVVDLQRLEAGGQGTPNTRDMPVAARRHFLLLFDMSFASPAAIARARAAAVELVREDLHPTDLVSVATYSLNAGARLALGFTSDREQVSVAIAGLAAPDSVQVRSDPLRLYVGSLEGGDISDDRAVQGSASGERGSMVEAQARSLQAMADRAQANQGRREISAMTRSLSELAQMLRSIDGRKHVVFFSEGFDSDLLLGATDERRRDEMVRRAQDNALWEVDSSEYFGSADTLAVLENMVKAFRRADCAIHSVDVGGLRAATGSGAGAVGGKDGLFMMARETGGSFYDNFNDLGQAMGQMLEKTSVTYVLRYQPRDLEPNGDYRKLKVQVRGLPRKARVSHRPGYFAPDASTLPSTAEMQLRLAQRLLDGRSGGTIGVGVLPVALRAAAAGNAGPGAGELPPGAQAADWTADAAFVPVLVEVDGASFLADQDSAEAATSKVTQGEKSQRERQRTRPRAKARTSGKTQGSGKTAAPELMRAEVFLYAMAADGTIADFYAQSIELDLRNVGEALYRRGFKLYAPLILAEGVYDLRVLVRNSRTGHTGLVISTFEVPSLGPGSAVLLPPLFPEPTEEWILVRGHRQETGEGGEPPYPYFHGGATYVPAARPELVAGQVVPVFLAGYQLDGVESLSSDLVDVHGESVATPRWKVDPRSMVGEDGLERLVSAFETPSVAAGEYALELVIEGRSGERSTVGRVPVRILAAGASTDQRLMALSTPVSFEEAGTASDLPSRAPTSPEEDGRDALAMNDFEAAYGRALARLPTTGRATLVPELAALEARALGQHPERRAARLARAERGVARRLAKQDPEVLLPLMLLHQDLYLEHALRRRPHLELHSRERVAELAELYVSESDTPQARAMAARMSTSLGGHLQEDGRLASVELFEQALRFDPANEAARLGLAAFYEKRGGPYETVVEQLRALVAHRPESREGQLRLAINEVRQAAQRGTIDRGGVSESARSRFEALIAAGADDWVHSLAAQELARCLARDGDRGSAIAVLESASERMPDDQKLAVQLSFLLDRAGQPERARRLVESVVGSRLRGVEVGEAPRGRYNRWPDQALLEDRRILAAGARERLTALGRLASPAGEQGVRGVIEGGQ